MCILTLYMILLMNWGYAYLKLIYKSFLVKSTFSVSFTGMFHPIHKWQLFWTWGSAVLRDALPWASQLTVLWMSEAYHRPLYHCYGKEVPPRAFCLCLLLETAQQGHLQRAEWQALLSQLLYQALLLDSSHQPPLQFNHSSTSTNSHSGTWSQWNRNYPVFRGNTDFGLK